MLRRALFPFFLFSVVGCSANTATSGPASETDAGGKDSSVVTDGSTEASAGDTGPAACKSNADCASSAGGKVCDTTSGKCVGCTAASDTCPASQHCDEALKSCVEGCKSDDGCATTTADAGTDGGDAGGFAKSRCDVAKHTCVECLKDDNCPLGYLCAGNVCSKGCSPTKACPATEACCGGACIDPTTNVDNCGKCGTKCTVAGGTAKCEGGACVVATCDGLKGDCDRDITNACETDLSSLTSNCGSCGNKCPLVVNGSPKCELGKCGAACSTNYGDCDDDLSNGCEAPLLFDANNCGTCKNKCTVTGSICSDGKCAIGTCPGTTRDCDKVVSNGCEVDVSSDNKNCGACGNACAVANGVGACATSKCSITSCTAPFADCVNGFVDGCESDTSSSTSHCGGCGKACTVANGTPKCATGACAIDTCNPGFADCNSSYTDGCESNSNTDVKNCGTCGNACPTGQICAAGVCMVSVGATWTASFSSGATYTTSSTQCTTWNTFRASLSGTYSKVTISGSASPTGVSCTGTNANTLCQALRTGTAISTSIACDGRNWRVGTCGSGIELSANGDMCQCTSGYVVRPCIATTSNWGGVNGPTCSGAPTQTMTVKCE